MHSPGFMKISYIDQCQQSSAKNGEGFLKTTCYKVGRRFAAILGAQNMKIVTRRADGLYVNTELVWNFQSRYQRQIEYSSSCKPWQIAQKMCAMTITIFSL